MFKEGDINTDFYNNDERWNNLVEDLSTVYFDEFYPDATTYGVNPLQSGDTVRYADGADKNLYHVMMVRRDGNVLLADSNNITHWTTIDELEKALTSAAESPWYSDDNREMTGGVTSSEELAYNWKKASMELGVEIGDIVHIANVNVTGQVIGTIAKDKIAKVAYYDPFGQIHCDFFSINNLTKNVGIFEKFSNIVDEIEWGLEKTSNSVRADIQYEAERMRLEGIEEDTMLTELADSFNVSYDSLKDIIGSE